MYEPGSTFKLVTYSAALDAAGVEPTDIVDCQGGAMTMYGRTLHDDKSDHYGRITVMQALGALVRRRCGEDGAEGWERRSSTDICGRSDLGTGSGIELPSETRGLLQPPKKWGCDEHPVDGDWAGSGGDAGAAW